MNIAIFVEKQFHVQAFLNGIGVDTIDVHENQSGLIGYSFQRKNNYLITPVISTNHTLNYADVFHNNGFNTFIRFGTGGIIKKGKIGDLILIDECLNIDALSSQYFYDPSPKASQNLAHRFKDINCIVENKNFTVDLLWQDFDKNNVNTVDMETSALYCYSNAKKLNAISFSLLRDHDHTSLTNDEIYDKFRFYSPPLFKKLEGL